MDIKVIGRCIINYELLVEELPQTIFIEQYGDKSSYRHIWQSTYDSIYMQLNKEDKEIYKSAYDKVFKDYLWAESVSSDEESIAIIKKKFSESLMEDIKAAKAMNLSFKCYLYTDTWCVVSLSGTECSYWLLPSVYIKLEKYKNYDELSSAERKALTTDNAEMAIIGLDDVSINDVVSKTETINSKIDDLNNHIANVKSGKDKELADLQQKIDNLTAQLEQKKFDLMEELNAKKVDMEAQLDQMNNLLFKLESEIYAIRCYTGENVSVNKIKSGNPAPMDTPIVFYQKLRYMDEELGKVAGINNVDFSNVEYFEQLLAENDVVLNTFIPSDRGIVLVRVSRTNNGYTLNLEYGNILETYEKYHGKKIGIIIKDGDNVYLTWTDDDIITFSNDAFLKYETKVKSELGEFEKRDYESDESYEQRISGEQKKSVKEMLARYYVFSILQGLLDRKLIELPEKTNLVDSEHIIYSYAEGWLDNNKYGTLETMIEKANSSIKVGDAILMTTSLRAHNEYNRYDNGSWHNDRGRGERNRTHDVQAKDNTIYNINYIEHRASYTYTLINKLEPRKLTKYTPGKGFEDYIEPKEKEGVYNHLNKDEYDSLFNRDFSYVDWERINPQKIQGSDIYEYFVSLPKTYSYGNARANFQVYEEEFINLTYMNSVWLTYVLNSTKTGTVIFSRARVDFAHLIPYINTALTYVKDREGTVANYIKELHYEYILQDEEWPAKLSEWMLENNIHNFSKFRTKQFIKACY